MLLFMRSGLKLGQYFIIAKEIWNEETHVDDAKIAHDNSMIFPIGKPNGAFAKYFVE